MRNHEQPKNESVLREFTKVESKAIQGLAILFMVTLHLFCRLDNLPYQPWIWIGDKPLVYYLGQWGDQCVALYCFCAGYAAYLLQERSGRTEYWKGTSKRLLRLLVNYWLIVCVFAVLGILFDNSGRIPGSVLDFLGNILLVRVTYNGAWWFMLTYVILTLMSGILYVACKRFHTVLVFGVAGIIYFVTYLVRFDKISLDTEFEIVQWCINQAALLGTSLLPYIMGMLTLKLKLVSRVRALCADISVPVKFVGMTAVVALGVYFHGAVVQSLIIAPILAVITLVWVAVMPDTKNGYIKRFLSFMGEHSLNIWLVHMFFYSTLFTGFIFIFKYPIVIYLAMTFFCLGVSIVIKRISNVICSLLHIR